MGGHHHHHGCNHNHFDFSHIEDNRLKILATYAAVGIAFFLILIKVAAWMLTGSVSVLSSLADSFLDVAASTVNFFAIRHAMCPPDAEHRFGHGKIEALAALAQSGLILGSVAYVIYEAFQRLGDAQPVTRPMVGIVVMILSTFLTGILVWFQTYVVKRTNSIAIIADSMHYKTDLFLNMGVLLSLVVTLTFANMQIIDPLVGLAVAAYILYTSYKIAARAVDILIDRELSTETREKIFSIIRAHPGVMGCHDLRTRSSGTHEFIQIHVEMDGNLNLRESHVIVDELHASLHNLFPKAHILIHQDPDHLKGPKDDDSSTSC